MPSYSWSEGIRVVVLSVTLAIASACSSSAPKLPPDYGSVAPTATLSANQFSQAERSKTCASIGEEQRAIAKRTTTLTGQVDSVQEKNQNISYVAAFVTPLAALAMEPSTEEKAELKQLQQRWDKLVALRRFKKCG